MIAKIFDNSFRVKVPAFVRLDTRVSAGGATGFPDFGLADERSLVRLRWLPLCVTASDGCIQHETVPEAVGLSNAGQTAISTNQPVTGLAERDEVTPR